MNLALIPQPRFLEFGTGTCRLGDAVAIGDHRLDAITRFAGERCIALPGQDDALTVTIDGELAPARYRLSITAAGVCLAGGSVAACRNGLHTLEQIRRQQDDPDLLPVLEIDDEPAFAARGVYYDVARGRVPEVGELLRQMAELASYKINEYQLYIEHTFTWRAHPAIGENADGLTPDDILELQEAADALGIAFVPSLATFGHMGKILTLPPYHHLAEDHGVGDYSHPDPQWTHKLLGWTLSPANPQIYDFLDELFREFLPLFSSEVFNICCDETWDLGWGQTHDLCEERGKGRVYLEHILKVREIAARYGKRVQMWGDIILKHPELIPELPADVTVLDWGYGADRDMGSLDHFKAAGLPFYGCPGTSSWVTLFPRLPESRANIHRFAVAARDAGAVGLLNTDWGDGGHYNWMENSWYGYLFGAEQSWNPDADQGTFTMRFTRLFLGTDDPDVVAAIDTLGDIAQTNVAGYYQSAWRHAFFATPDERLWADDQPEGSIAVAGEIRRGPVSWNAAYGRETADRLRELRAPLAKLAASGEGDPLGVLPYWLFAIDTLEHAAAKLAAFGAGGEDSPLVRHRLAAEMESLRERFVDLWLARNRRSEIEITLDYYDQAITGLRA